MIQIGEAFFDESFCFGIAPDRDSRQTRGSIVFLQNGSRVAIDATTEDVAAALRENGLLTDSPEDEAADKRVDPADNLTNKEREELVDCINNFYNYIAKDVRGVVTAFHTTPIKEGVYWNKQAIDPCWRRLSCAYSSLEFDEGYLSISDILYGEEDPFF